MDLTTQLKTILGSALALLIVGTIGTLLVMRANLKTELAETRARETLCLTANQAWVEASERQKKAIDVLKGLADARLARLAEAEKRGARAAKDFEKRAALFARTQPDSKESCASVSKLLRAYREAQP